MTITIEAIYENGVLRPVEPLPLAEHDKVHVTVQTPVAVQSALAAVEQGYGLVPWTGGQDEVDRAALDPEYGILESP